MAREAKYKRLPMTTREVDIIRRLKKHVQLPVAKIALAVGRDKKTIYNALSSKWSMKKRGRHPKLTCKEINFIVRTAKAMIQNAKACKEVTLEMIMRRAKTKACARTVRKALQQRKIRFRKMRSKPVLTAEDVIDRKRFAAKYRHKSRAWWRSKVDLYIDLKKFPVYPTHKFRALAAQREVRGAYRQPSQGLDEAYVVVPKHLKQNPGVKGATIAGGVGKGKVRLWHDVGKKWTAAVASELYLGPVRAAMRRATPRKRKFQILEDNDPTGFRSKAGLAAKRLGEDQRTADTQKEPGPERDGLRDLETDHSQDAPAGAPLQEEQARDESPVLGAPVAHSQESRQQLHRQSYRQHEGEMQAIARGEGQAL